MPAVFAEKRCINETALVRRRSDDYLAFLPLARWIPKPNNARERMDWHRDLGFLLYDVAQLYTRRFESRARNLSQSAKPVVERACEMGRDTSTEALKGVSSDELHLLVDLLERVRTNLLALAVEPVPAWRRDLRRNSLRTVG